MPRPRARVLAVLALLAAPGPTAAQVASSDASGRVTGYRRFGNLPRRVR